MLGSFWSSRRDTTGGGGDTTPKAPAHSNPDRERNPFETSLSSSSASGSSSSILPGRHSRKNSATTLGTSASGGAGGLSSSTMSSSSSSGSVQQHHSHLPHHHGVPTGLRTPTLQKSFVLPEITSSINATGSHASNSSISATSALHHSPMNNSSNNSSTASGRNTPTRTSHQHTPSGPYPNPKEHPVQGSPKIKQQQQQQAPEFKLSQPPDSKGSPNKQQLQQTNSKIDRGGGGTGTDGQGSALSKTPTTAFHQNFSSESANNNISPSSQQGTPSTASSTGSGGGSSGTGATASTISSTSATSSQHSGSSRKRDQHGSSSLKGKLTVKIIEARNLITPEANVKPYVVATFEQNEFVSREAINEHEGDATGQPVSPRTSSHLRSSHRANSSLNTNATNGNGNGNGHGRTSPEDAMETDNNGGTFSAYNPVWKHEVAFDVTLDHSPVTVCVYARRGDEEFFLGLVDVKPRLQHGWTVDDWYSLHARQDEHVTGDVHVRMRFDRSEQRRTLRSSDFEFLRMIGKGTFGRVFQVRKKDTKRIYAMKVLSKREIIAKKEVQHTIGERKILQRSSECPFLLGLKFSFQSETELFLVMDFKSGGELFHHLQKEGRFTEDRARFYAAEITLAFEYLHKYNIVYRDLKPENILLDATGHIVLCDFGLSKPDLPSNALTNTFCGTTEYLAPEVLLDDHGYSQTVDFWSLGVLLFEMCCGWSPFYAEDTQQMYKNICFGKIKFPRGVIGDDGKQFVKGLLNRNPAHRLGAKRDAAELKEHPFFRMIDWEALAARQVTVPFKPYVDSDECVRNFDAEFTDADILREAPVDTGAYFDDDPSSLWVDEPPSGNDPRTRGPVPIHPSKNRLDEEAQDAFRGFSYSGDAELNDLMMSASLRENDDMSA